MVKKITKIGNSCGLVFNSTVMSRARLKVGDKVNVEVHAGGTITLTPLWPRPPRKKVTRVVKATIKDYSRTMKRLA